MVVTYIMTVLIFMGIVFWPGFLLYTLCANSKDTDILEITVGSTAFGLSSLVIVCLILDSVWEISLVSVGCWVLFMSGAYIFKRPSTFKLIGMWEFIVIGLIFGYGFLLRSFSLFDALPQGQDAWVHLSFMHHIFETHHISQSIPWLELEKQANLVLYPPGSHCVGALLSSAFSDIPFSLIKGFFIAIGTSSCVSLYIVARKIMAKKTAALSALLVATFVPHMVMTTEIIAQALAIFLFPLVCYYFYKKNIVATSILLGGVIIMHHVTGFATVLSLITIAAVLSVQQKKWKWILSFLGVGVCGLVFSVFWWGQKSFDIMTKDFTSILRISESFSYHIQNISPLFIIFLMIGGVIALKKRYKEKYIFLISWGLALFLASQFPFPLKLGTHRFIHFFVFPGSILAAVGLLKIYSLVQYKMFLFLILLMFSAEYSQQFWPSIGEENFTASEWLEDSTLDSVVYVYGRYYVFVYVIAERQVYEIYDYDNPFEYSNTGYFYEDKAWVSHDIENFGQFDRVYACSKVVIVRITED